jgi:hypothetical protein
MKGKNLLAELVAPCGMNCTLYKDYQAYINNKAKEKGKTNHCPGCPIRNKNCYIKRDRPKLRKKQINSCHQSPQMPCSNLEHIDRRYKERHNMSMVENLKQIKQNKYTTGDETN